MLFILNDSTFWGVGACVSENSTGDSPRPDLLDEVFADQPEVVSLSITPQVIIEFVQKDTCCQLSVLRQGKAVGHVWDLASNFQNFFESWGERMQNKTQL